jgi:hypothetical protein
MLPKVPVVFDKTALSNLKLIIIIKNIDETDSKQPKIHRAYGFKKSQEKNPQTKSRETFAKSS